MPCRLTKMRFDKLGVKYQERSAEEADRSLGYTSAPIVVVDCGDGATHSWSGFRLDRIQGVADLLS